MQDTLTFPTTGSPHHRFTFSQSYDTGSSERCSQVSTPFVSAPSSPGRHGDGGFYFSAPASPHWAYTFTGGGMHPDYPSSIPLHWDERPATPQRRSNGKDDAGSFLMASEFEFSARFADLDDPSMSPTPMSSANELFCNGQIKPLRIPARTEYPSCPTGRINIKEHGTSRLGFPEHATSCIHSNDKYAIAASPEAFDFHNRIAYTGDFHNRIAYAGVLSSSMSVLHRPQFSSVLDCASASVCGIDQVNKGRSAANSLSAPQSPRVLVNRVRGAFCGVSPSKINRALHRSMDRPVEGCRQVLQGSHRKNKSFDAAMHPSLQGSKEISRHGREFSRRSDCTMLSFALGSQASGHRRTKSFSPLRLFQRGECPSCSSSMGGTLQEDTTCELSRDSSESEKKHDEEFNSASKSSNRKWTLKDLLHRKSGGENRSNSGRTTSSRRSGASADSPSSSTGAKSMGMGRSSSESSQSSISTTNTHTKEASTGKGSSRGRMEGLSNESYASKKGVKQAMGEGKESNSNKGSKGGMCKAKGPSQRACAQRGNNNKGCISPHEMHYMMHKAQSEELRKRTFLPYRQGLLGCLGFSKSYRTVSSLSKALQSVSG